jgi:biopolymer transport protein ExbD
MSWLVRKEGSDTALSLPSAAAVMVGLRDGNWLGSDEVKGPDDADWQTIENHPLFAEAAEAIEPPRAAETDETTLDMNPLIDVCLVLLIFFILTISYASLERSIDIPEDSSQQKGPSVKMDIKDIRDRVFIVTARMDGDRPVVTVEKVETPIPQIGSKIKEIINTTGRKEMVLDIEKDVPWGVETAILDAARGNGVHDIINNWKR